MEENINKRTDIIKESHDSFVKASFPIGWNIFLGSETSTVFRKTTTYVSGYVFQFQFEQHLSA